VRHTLGLRPAPEFEAWLSGIGLLDADGRVSAVDVGATLLKELVR